MLIHRKLVHRNQHGVVENEGEIFSYPKMDNAKPTLASIIRDHTIELFNYEKHDGHPSCNPTGYAVKVNECNDLAVIDVDINKNLDEPTKKMVQGLIILKLPDDCVVVQTVSGGLHIYARLGNFKPTSNRMIKCYSNENYNIDLFTSVDSNKRSLVVLPGSQVKKCDGQIGSYKFLRGDMISTLNHDVMDLMLMLGIVLASVTKQPSPRLTSSPGEQNENNNTAVGRCFASMLPDHEVADNPFSVEQCRLLVMGLDGLEIHADSGSRMLRDEITLMPLFQALNALPVELIDWAYDWVWEHAKLTNSAWARWDEIRSRNEDKSSSTRVLMKVLQCHNKSYLNEHASEFDTNAKIKALQGPRVQIDLHDEFNIGDFRGRCPYDDLGEAVHDLQRCLLVVDNTPELFIMKNYDDILGGVRTSHTHEDPVRQKLKKIVVKVNIVNYKPKNYTAWDLYVDHASMFHWKGISFFSEDPDVFSEFSGYDYEQVEHVDLSLIQPFLTHVHDVIAAGDDDVYDYVLNWFAAIIQQPCFKTETALVLISKQGVGKNRFFTDVLCKLLSRYAAKNVTNMDHIVGKFNSTLENMKLVVVNELQSAEFNRVMNSDTLKSIITDDTVIINQKMEPIRTIKNVANFILVSNNAVPVKVESDDRRYVVINPSDIHRLDDAYFDSLASSFTPEFYRHLFTFFMARDITNVNLRHIPKTQARDDLIDANKPSYELFVEDHFDELVDITGDELYQGYKCYCERGGYMALSKKNLIAHLKRFTGESKRKRMVDGRRVRVFNLLPEVRTRLEDQLNQ